MISYERIDCSEFIDLGRGEESVKCMIYNYFYFRDGFKYQSYVCNGCHDFSMTAINLSDFLFQILRVLIIGSMLVVLIKTLQCIFQKILV